MKSLITLLFSLFSLSLFANENISRLGLGVTQEAANDLPAISFKVHFGEEGALGGFFWVPIRRCEQVRFWRKVLSHHD